MKNKVTENFVGRVFDYEIIEHIEKQLKDSKHENFSGNCFFIVKPDLEGVDEMYEVYENNKKQIPNVITRNLLFLWKDKQIDTGKLEKIVYMWNTFICEILNIDKVDWSSIDFEIEHSEDENMSLYISYLSIKKYMENLADFEYFDEFLHFNYILHLFLLSISDRINEFSDDLEILFQKYEKEHKTTSVFELDINYIKENNITEIINKLNKEENHDHTIDSIIEVLSVLSYKYLQRPGYMILTDVIIKENEKYLEFSNKVSVKQSDNIIKKKEEIDSKIDYFGCIYPVNYSIFLNCYICSPFKLGLNEGLIVPFIAYCELKNEAGNGVGSLLEGSVNFTYKCSKKLLEEANLIFVVEYESVEASDLVKDSNDKNLKNLAEVYDSFQNIKTDDPNHLKHDELLIRKIEDNMNENINSGENEKGVENEIIESKNDIVEVKTNNVKEEHLELEFYSETQKKFAFLFYIKKLLKKASVENIEKMETGIKEIEKMKDVGKITDSLLGLWKDTHSDDEYIKKEYLFYVELYEELIEKENMELEYIDENISILEEEIKKKLKINSLNVDEIRELYSIEKDDNIKYMLSRAYILMKKKESFEKCKRENNKIVLLNNLENKFEHDVFMYVHLIRDLFNDIEKDAKIMSMLDSIKTSKKLGFQQIETHIKELLSENDPNIKFFENDSKKDDYFKELNLISNNIQKIHNKIVNINMNTLLRISKISKKLYDIFNTSEANSELLKELKKISKQKYVILDNIKDIIEKNVDEKSKRYVFGLLSELYYNYSIAIHQKKIIDFEQKRKRRSKKTFGKIDYEIKNIKKDKYKKNLNVDYLSNKFTCVNENDDIPEDYNIEEDNISTGDFEFDNYKYKDYKDYEDFLEFVKTKQEKNIGEMDDNKFLSLLDSLLKIPKKIGFKSNKLYLSVDNTNYQKLITLTKENLIVGLMASTISAYFNEDTTLVKKYVDELKKFDFNGEYKYKDYVTKSPEGYYKFEKEKFFGEVCEKIYVGEPVLSSSKFGEKFYNFMIGKKNANKKNGKNEKDKKNEENEEIANMLVNGQVSNNKIFNINKKFGNAKKVVELEKSEDKKNMYSNTIDKIKEIIDDVKENEKNERDEIYKSETHSEITQNFLNSLSRYVTRAELILNRDITIGDILTSFFLFFFCLTGKKPKKYIFPGVDLDTEPTEKEKEEIKKLVPYLRNSALQFTLKNGHIEITKESEVIISTKTTAKKENTDDINVDEIVKSIVGKNVAEFYGISEDGIKKLLEGKRGVKRDRDDETENKFNTKKKKTNYRIPLFLEQLKSVNFKRCENSIYKHYPDNILMKNELNRNEILTLKKMGHSNGLIDLNGDIVFVGNKGLMIKKNRVMKYNEQYMNNHILLEEIKRNNILQDFRKETLGNNLNVVKLLRSFMLMLLTNDKKTLENVLNYFRFGQNEIKRIIQFRDIMIKWHIRYKKEDYEELKYIYYNIQSFKKALHNIKKKKSPFDNLDNLDIILRQFCLLNENWEEIFSENGWNTFELEYYRKSLSENNNPIMSYHEILELLKSIH